MSTDSRIQKIIAGTYRVGDYSVIRNQSQWLVIRHNGNDVCRSFREATLVALILSGTATDKECNEYRHIVGAI